MNQGRLALGLFARLLFILAIPVIALTASIAWGFNNLGLYQAGFEKYEVARVTGLAPAELHKVAAGLIQYFNSGDADINLVVIKDGQPFTLFNQREVDHLRDVKALVWLDYRALLGGLTYAIGYAAFFVLTRRDLRALARGLVTGGLLGLGLIALLGLAALVDFERFFLSFHLISFSNSLWQLDPSRDYLIMLVPQGFWMDAAKFVVTATAGGAALFGALGGAFLLINRHK